MRSVKRFAVGVVAALAAFALPSPAASQVEDYREIKAPPLREWKIQQPRRVELPNGMVIFLQEDRELPLVQGYALVRGGSREVPADKTGLIGIYGQTWRTGGTKTRTGDELDEFLESRAAKVETSGDEDSTSISFDALRDDFDVVFPIFVDLLRNPEFREEKIALAKNQLNTSIARRNDDVGSIASREAVRLAYGADSPYARVPEYDTVAAVTRDDLLAWHRRYVHPNNIILGIVGDFDAKKMEAQLRTTFRSWKRGPQAEVPEVLIKSAEPGVYFVAKEDVTQSVIRLVHLGTTKADPDYYAIQVMNEIFGGGFSGRLINKIRSEMGLAYSVGGGVGTAWDHPGMFQISMGTKSGTTLEAIDALHAEIDTLQKGPITPSELALAKESILNSYIFLLDSDEKVLNQRMALEFYGYPPDFLERYRTGVQRVTEEDVLRVARKHVRPGEIAVLVVGRQEDFDRPLSTLGEVREIDITIPQPGAASEPVAGNPEGRALLEKVRGFLLPGTTVDEVDAVRKVSDLQVTTPQGEMQLEQEVVIDYPDRLLQLMRLPMGEMKMVLTPEAAFMAMGPNVRDLPASQKENLQQELAQDLLMVLRNIDQPSVSLAAGEREQIGEVNAQALHVDASGAKFTLWIDPATGRILRKASISTAMGAPTEQVVDFDEWETFDGVRTAKSFTISANGEPAGKGTVKTFEVNPTVDAAIFARPAAGQ